MTTVVGRRRVLGPAPAWRKWRAPSCQRRKSPASLVRRSAPRAIGSACVRRRYSRSFAARRTKDSSVSTQAARATVPYQTVAEHWPVFRERAERAGCCGSSSENSRSTCAAGWCVAPPISSRTPPLLATLLHRPSWSSTRHMEPHVTPVELLLLPTRPKLGFERPSATLFDGKTELVIRLYKSAIFLGAFSAAACAPAPPWENVCQAGTNCRPERGSEVVCEEYRDLVCAGNARCDFDRTRGCEVCRCCGPKDTDCRIPPHVTEQWKTPNRP